ncbi:GNAT family N-acetyltransferase [Intrasporangium sp.]|uniref:GNAT family N-acetyltransferase n=1 Tax=Intrasporangium sp. TaxID=1925024 RepID=UPI002939E4ED|nr:GNAT family N-acetyltransferase [Intrasporangium sp.]MDV3221651.1 GNAT family N-acetyltransferase [Intrasporangium sp.]
MPLSHSEFSGRGDLRDMQAMCSRVWTPQARFHPGQLAWNRYSHPVDPDRVEPGDAIALWRAGGEVVGFGWAEGPDWLELQVDPSHPEVVGEVIDWFENWSDAPRQSVLTMDGDGETALADAGFHPERDGWHLTHHVLDLTRLPPVPEVAGYRFRPVSPDEVGPRAAAHRAAWSEFGESRVTSEAYAAVMATWPYRHDLDWVAVDDVGDIVATAIVWLDETIGVGLIEPVGCVPGHRRRGLAGAVTLAALHRARELGAHTALVSPRGDDDYPGPRRLYQALGFRPVTRTVTWTRSLG